MTSFPLDPLETRLLFLLAVIDDVKNGQDTNMGFVCDALGCTTEEFIKAQARLREFGYAKLSTP